MLEGFWYICTIVAQKGVPYTTEYQKSVLHGALYSTGYWYSRIYVPKILPPPYSIVLYHAVSIAVLVKYCT